MEFLNTIDIHAILIPAIPLAIVAYFTIPAYFRHNRKKKGIIPAAPNMEKLIHDRIREIGLESRKEGISPKQYYKKMLEMHYMEELLEDVRNTKITN